MNSYLEQQHRSISNALNIYENACSLVATKNDGATTKSEMKAINSIKALNAKYLAKLAKLSDSIK